MFSTARIRLTGWYLLIIMFISIFFSVIIYRMVSVEIERFAFRQRARVEGPFFQREFSLPDVELIDETKRRFILLLGLVNGGILIVSGGLAYYLAGKTLRPIQDMVDEQNRFISDSSHELRTPLASLKTALEVNLRDRQLTLKDAKKLISESIGEVNQLQSLTDGLLQLAQYQKSNGYVQMTNISLQHVVKTAIDKISPLASNKNIIIQNSVADCQIVGNQHGLIELLTILLDNAIKYSPQHSKIRLFSRQTSHHIYLSIKDHGIGINLADIPHIFDRFYRADTARTKTKTSGYGLGLSIAKQIADHHRSTINIDSRPGKGSTFTVKLQLSS